MQSHSHSPSRSGRSHLSASSIARSNSTGSSSNSVNSAMISPTLSSSTSKNGSLSSTIIHPTLPRSSSLTSSLSLDTDRAQAHAIANAVDSHLVSPTALLSAYGRPSIDSVAAGLVKERLTTHTSSQQLDTEMEDELEDEDNTAYTRSGQYQEALHDEDATIKIPQPSNTSKKLPKPPRPPRMRPLSQAISTTSTASTSFDEPRHSYENDLLKMDSAPSSSAETAIPAHFNRSTNASSTSLLRTASSTSRLAPSTSSTSSRPGSLVVNNSCTSSSIPSPFIDISSASSAASSYFIPTPGLTEGQVPHQGTFTPIHGGINAEVMEKHSSILHEDGASLGRALSQRGGPLQRNGSLLRAGGISDNGPHSHSMRASVYTMLTSASDWARERETEMRNSRSGVFDLGYDLQESRSGSSNEGHGGSNIHMSRSYSDQSPHLSTSQGREGHDHQNDLEDLSLVSSTSGFIAVSEPSSPFEALRPSRNCDANTEQQQRTGQLAPPQVLPATPTSPTSPGYGLGITSDDAVHPLSQTITAHSMTVSPDALSHQDVPLPDHSSEMLSSATTSPSKSRWSTTRSYIRRNTASSVRSLHRQQSKSSLLDTMNKSPSFPSLQHSSSCTSLSERCNQHASYDDTTSTGYNSESDRANTSTHLFHYTNPQSNHHNVDMPMSAFSSDYSSSKRPGKSQFGSVYTSKANSVLSTDSIVGDELEDGPPTSYEHKIDYEALQRGSLHPAGGSTRPTSQAVVMAESGKGKITKVLPEQNVDDLFIPTDTTHLIFSGVCQPVALRQTLSSALPGLADRLLVLDISSCNLSSIPQSIFLCSNLEELNMSGNLQMSGTLPPFISSLISLRVLLADSCGLNAISHSFANLKHLHTLALRNNALKYLPSWIARLSDSLELLLLEDNPFHGDYADLVKPCLQIHSPPLSATEVPSPGTAAKTSQDTSQEADTSFVSNASMNRVAAEPHEERDILSPGGLPSSIKSPRTSILSRASSVRQALNRSFSNPDDHSPSSQFSSPVNSLLLADTSSQASTARRRASILKPMKSMGDLSVTQPSIHELVSGDQENLPMRFPASPAFPISPSFSDTSTMESDKSSRPSPAVIQSQPSFRKSIAGSFAARRTRKSSKGMTALEFLANEVGDSFGSHAPPHFPEAVSSANVSPATEEKGKESRPGFFKKLSLATRRRKSNSMLNSDLPSSSPPPPLPVDHAELGLGRPPFLNSGSLRSNSAPDTVGARRPFSTRDDANELPQPPSVSNLPKSPSGTWQSSIQSSFMESSKRYRKKSRAPIPEPLLELKKTQEESKPAKRRSYLMLNSVLPPVISPGPLALTFDPSTGEDQTIHAKATLSTLVEEQSPTSANSGRSQQATAGPSRTNSPAFNQWSVEKRKAALAPLLAYLRDLDDLSRASDSRHTPEMPIGIPRRPTRKASSTAVSVVSSLQPDRSSGYESSRADSTGLTSPSSVQGPSHNSKMKDDPVKRDRVIAEIISSEKSYLASLQDLVALYIEPASAPLRVSGDANRETVIPQAERNLVFSVAESITQFHCTVFLPELEKAAVFVSGERNSASSLDQAVLRQTAIDVAKVFIDHSAFLKLYHSYIVNADTATDRASLWDSFKSSSSSNVPTPPTSATRAGPTLNANQRKRIRHLLKAARKDPRHTQMSLQSYLLMPIQRIPRYKLLLEALLECTPAVDCPDQGEPTISMALEVISKIASEMNERKRDNEGRQRLLYWQAQLSRFKSPLVQPHRTVLREGRMLLERVVKRDNAVVANLTASTKAEEADSSSLIQIPVLKVDRTRRKLIYVLCNDILILILDAEGSSAPTEKYETFTVLRLGKSLGGRDQPASIFGRPDRLRIVEDRAVLYLFCPDAESASTCRDLINRQSLQTGLNYRFMDGQT